MPVNPNRREFSLPKTEDQTLSGVAAVMKSSRSAVLRSIIEGFLEKGSDFEPEPLVTATVVMPAELIQQATQKARSENGCSLRDIIRYELQQMAKM
ncbi:hypothetical protein SEA_SADLAD_72 [Microbacterium phage SadLad]|nr:hypothetical protein SEA_SADLAD_72 [Microbacterium phage SadLad]